MPISNLANQLQDDAERAVPPFGAESVDIARRLGRRATDLLLHEIGSRSDSAFLALECLREADPTSYRALAAPERAQIYADALKNNVFYNAWGSPGHQLTATAYALVGLGEDAVTVLRPLLSDDRPAPLSGSQNATTSTMYGNRVCDYAWVLISEIRRRPYEYPADPEERDRAIETLRRYLERRDDTSPSEEGS